MATQPSASSARNRIFQEYEVNQEQEDQLMIRYTKAISRELVFAVDLMSFVMKLSNQHFRHFICPNCLSSRPSDFDDQIKTFTEQILAYKLKAGAKRAMVNNLKVDRASYEQFKSFVNASATRTKAVPHGEGVGYATYPFMLFCVMMAEMCTIAYQHGMTKAPRFGIMLMCRTFSNFDEKSAFPPNPWDWIKFVARAAVTVSRIVVARLAH